MQSFGGRWAYLFHVVFQLFPERGVDGHCDRSRQHEEDEHHDEGNECDVDGLADEQENPVHDTHDDAEYQYDEKHRPLAAVCRVVRRLDGFNRVLALVEQEIERERPGQGQHDARDDKEQGGDIDRDQHQPPCDEEFAHIAAVFAVEDRERIDHVAFGQFDG